MTVSSPAIHPTAIIHPSAQIGDQCEIGPYAVVGEGVTLAPRVRVGPHAVIEFAEVGEACHIHAGAFVGTAPQDLKYRNERTKLVVGPGCVVRECVTLNRGTAARGETRIGSRCLFMAYSHVAHDCIIGNEVIVANSVAIAGHCEVGDWSVLGGMVGLHQFVRVGKLAMIGAGSMVSLDILPFALAAGDRAVLSGLNILGLKRRGYTPEAISEIKKAYRGVFQEGKPFKEKIAELAAQHPTGAALEMLTFLQAESRGFCRPSSKKDASEEI